MTFKILVGDKENVDFNHPIELTSDERKKFFSLMRSLFSVVQEEEVEEFRDWRLGQDDRIQYPRSWEPEEYEVLLKSRSIEEAIDNLGRSGMAIIVQDGKWRPAFMTWCDEKGKDPFSGNLLQTIKEFLKEKKDEILSKRKKKNELKQEKTKLAELYEELTDWDSEKKKEIINLYILSGKIKAKNADEYIANKKVELIGIIALQKKKIEDIERAT